VLSDRRVRRVVLGGVVLFSALHLIFHARHAGSLAGAELGLSLLTLVLGVVVPAGLLALTWVPRARRG
jgi:hypothetical protein